MFDYNFETTYQSINDEKKSDDQYRLDLLRFFMLENYSDEEMASKTNLLYDTYKDNAQFKEILQCKIKHFKRLPFEMDEHISLIMLLSYENLHMFVKCLGDLHKNNVISKNNFDLLIDLIKTTSENKMSSQEEEN
jgi:hypothetical protein